MEIKNQFNKITQPLFEAFKGPRTKDYEYDKKVEEYRQTKEHMNTIKGIIDNYAQRLEGYNFTLTNIVSSFSIVFDRNQTYYCKFMNDVVGAHKSLGEKLRKMFGQMEKLKDEISKWNGYTTNVEKALNDRENTRKDYEHYDEKMQELYEDRSKTFSKGKIPSDRENEKYLRNIKKFQKAAKDYIEATNNAYKNMNQFMDARYENITLAVVGFIEIESAFYNEAAYIFNFFRNLRNNALALKNSLIPSRDDYNAENFIRGRHLLTIEADEIIKRDQPIKGVILGQPDFKRPKNNSVMPGGNNNSYGGGYGGNNNSQMRGSGNYGSNYGFGGNSSYNPYGGRAGGNNNPYGGGYGAGGNRGNPYQEQGGDSNMMNPFEKPGEPVNPYGDSGNSAEAPVNPYGGSASSAISPYGGSADAPINPYGASSTTDVGGIPPP